MAVSRTDGFSDDVRAWLVECLPRAVAYAEQPVEVVLTDELRRVLDQALEQCPVAQRAALELKSLGHSLEEIAEALSVTANHAGVLLHRARQAVRAGIAAYE